MCCVITWRSGGMLCVLSRKGRQRCAPDCQGQQDVACGDAWFIADVPGEISELVTTSYP